MPKHVVQSEANHSESFEIVKIDFLLKFDSLKLLVPPVK